MQGSRCVPGSKTRELQTFFFFCSGLAGTATDTEVAETILQHLRGEKRAELEARELLSGQCTIVEGGGGRV